VIIGRNLKNKLFLRLKREDDPRGHQMEEEIFE
jgi:hypothetical protein